MHFWSTSGVSSTSLLAVNLTKIDQFGSYPAARYDMEKLCKFLFLWSNGTFDFPPTPKLV